jgi:hypothetical protein
VNEASFTGQTQEQFSGRLNFRNNVHALSISGVKRVAFTPADA